MTTHYAMRRLAVGLTTVVLVSGGLGLAGVELAAGTAQASPGHWCPGDPPITTLNPATGQGLITINPDWDTTVCHDYMISGGQVLEGKACTLPQFQWFQCPPGTTPRPLMTPIPNKS